MKVLFLVAGVRAGSDLFHSLLDEHSQILQFPGILEINENFIDLVNLKNYYESEAYSINDTTTGYRWMMNENEDPFIQTFADYFMTHSSGLSMSSKIFKYITVTPSLS